MVCRTALKHAQRTGRNVLPRIPVTAHGSVWTLPTKASYANQTASLQNVMQLVFSRKIRCALARCDLCRASHAGQPAKRQTQQAAVVTVLQDASVRLRCRTGTLQSDRASQKETAHVLAIATKPLSRTTLGCRLQTHSAHPGRRVQSANLHVNTTSACHGRASTAATRRKTRR